MDLLPRKVAVSERLWGRLWEMETLEEFPERTAQVETVGTETLALGY